MEANCVTASGLSGPQLPLASTAGTQNQCRGGRQRRQESGPESPPHRAPRTARAAFEQQNSTNLPASTAALAPCSRRHCLDRTQDHQCIACSRPLAAGARVAARSIGAAAPSRWRADGTPARQPAAAPFFWLAGFFPQPPPSAAPSDRQPREWHDSRLQPAACCEAKGGRARARRTLAHQVCAGDTSVTLFFPRSRPPAAASHPALSRPLTRAHTTSTPYHVPAGGSCQAALASGRPAPF